MKKLRFSLCKSGFCSHPEVVTIKGGSFKSCQFPSLFGMFDHPEEGVVLYDTGYHPRYNEQKGTFPEGLYPTLIPATINENETALNQVKAQGKIADDVRWIIISHFHGDHIAGLLDFPKANFLCLKSAYENTFNKGRFRNLLNGFLPNLIPTDFLNRVVWIDDCKNTTDELGTRFRSYDLFNDSSLKAIELPGHKHGQVGLHFEDDSHGTCLMIADASWSTAAVTEFRPPAKVAFAIIDDHKSYLKTLKELHDLNRRRPDLHFIPSHCHKTFNTLKRAQP